MKPCQGLGKPHLLSAPPHLPSRIPTSRALQPSSPSRRRCASHVVRARGGGSRQLSVGVDPKTEATSPASSDAPVTVLMGVVLLLQSVALVGATVGGFLARQRRISLEKMNQKLREVNLELRKRREQETHVCEASESEGLLAYKSALEVALDAPSAPHPVEEYGPDGYSLAQARREFSIALQDAKGALLCENGKDAMTYAARAKELAVEIKDERARRSAIKVTARAHRVLGHLSRALKSLEETLVISEELGESSGNVDTYGEMADIHADMGNFELAGENYDKCIASIQTDDIDPISPFWDC